MTVEFAFSVSALCLLNPLNMEHYISFNIKALGLGKSHPKVLLNFGVVLMIKFDYSL